MESSGKIIPLSEAAAFRATLRQSGRRVVATNGCFDLLHVGHLRYLTQARERGDFLWVGLNADASVRELKGPTRPVNTEADRAEVLAALRVVDAVTIFPDVRAVRFLEAVAPDLYVKGGDYKPETLDAGERAAVAAGGGTIEILPLVPGKSTTATLERIKS
ncbi:MAG TPA: adenylyltransferase/cytidyltransferase family protein [Candidatus Methylacidiphilales bacterium]